MQAIQDQIMEGLKNMQSAKVRQCGACICPIRRHPLPLSVFAKASV